MTIAFRASVTLLALATACMNSDSKGASAAERLARYKTVSIAPSLSGLDANDQKMIPHLIEAARAMDEVFWVQAYGDKAALISSIKDSATRALTEVNYGPWDRLDANHAFIAAAGERPEGANYYPKGMTKAEFEKQVEGGGKRADSLKSLYTMIRRDAAGQLEAIPFSKFFAEQHARAAKSLEAAAALSTDAGFKKYLTLRAKALLDDNYQPSDMAWMDMKTNPVDVVIGPIETYEDEMFGYKAAHETVVLLKDMAWSARLTKFAAMLPSLQRGIPVAAEYKKESPGANSDLNAYDVIYVSGQANTGAKTIAINLPNDEEVQLKKGARRLQLKNAMRAKFDMILVPIAKELIADDQQANITFDAFFENIMFHEVAHGLGIKNTINGKGTVRTALKERYSASEEGKADILGLYMVKQLRDRGDLKGGKMEDNYVDFLASIFRSVRFGTGDSHGRANIAALNFLQERGAFTRDSATGKYRVDFAKMQEGANALSQTILKFQGDGDYEGYGAFQAKYGALSPQLQAELARLTAKNIPVDILYNQ
jgi:hypothetical protein